MWNVFGALNQCINIIYELSFDTEYWRNRDIFIEN